MVCFADTVQPNEVDKLKRSHRELIQYDTVRLMRKEDRRKRNDTHQRRSDKRTKRKCTDEQSNEAESTAKAKAVQCRYRSVRRQMQQQLVVAI